MDIQYSGKRFSENVMSNLRTLRFFLSPQHPCSYLPEQQASSLFVDPATLITTDLYSHLSELGFRRSGDHVYRPKCAHCDACKSIRIIAPYFKPSRSQKRVINSNKDISVSRHEPAFTEERYQLYHDYITHRHADGEMYPPSVEQFNQFLIHGSTAMDSCFFEFRDAANQLVAIAVTDILVHGFSALYTFYDPKLPKRSLGTFAILWQIQEIQRQQLNYLFLGYWIQKCHKMNYKSAFPPLEILIDGEWTLFTPDNFE